ncbi:MAG: DUF2269 family protein [Actinomycetota bacterium]
MGSWVLFGHIVSGFVLFAGMSLAAAGWHLARARSAPAEVALLLKLCRIGALAVAAATLSVLGFGLWLVDLQGHRLSDAWISWAIGLLVVAMVAGIVGGQRPKKARLLAQSISGENGADREALRRLLDDPASAVLNYLATGCILVILFLMVFKPQ